MGDYKQNLRGQNNDFGRTKRVSKIFSKKTVNIPLVPPNSFGPPTMVAVVPDFKDRGQCGSNEDNWRKGKMSAKLRKS